LAPATAALSDSGESPEAESDAESPIVGKPCAEEASVAGTLLAVLAVSSGQIWWWDRLPSSKVAILSQVMPSR